MRCCHSVFVERYSVAYCMPALWDALVSTWMGDRLGIPGAVSFSFAALATAVCSISAVPATTAVAYGHTTLNTPDLVRSRKLSRVGPG